MNSSNIANSPTSTHREFDRALLGQTCWLELANGQRIELPVTRWRNDADADDRALLHRCVGPTIDLGCGPGRLTEALLAGGVPALGVDSSPVAIELARRRGVLALHRDLFAPLPGEGRWAHALLADGNVGIGGDPVATLRRAGSLVQQQGCVLVELAPPGWGTPCGPVRVGNGRRAGDWFRWGWLGVDELADAADSAALRVDWLGQCGRRWFAELGKVGRP